MQNGNEHNIQEQQKKKKKTTSTTYESSPKKTPQMKKLESLWVLYIVGLLYEGAALNLKPKFPFPSQTLDPRP
jgi:hypothetical protein